MATKMRSGPREPWDTTNFTYKELKIACITRGMDFSEVVDGDWPRLSHWYRHNFYQPVQEKRISEFEAYVDQQLAAKYDEKDPMRLYRLTYSQEAEGKVTAHKISAKKAGVTTVKPKKTKRVRDEKVGIFSGTKKHLTFQLTAQGFSLKKIIRKVKEVYPDAVDKSIGIWYKKALKAMPESPEPRAAKPEPPVEVLKKKKKKVAEAAPEPVKKKKKKR